jgi:pimeloyl-ACP methyl ester carboxylesterase
MLSASGYEVLLPLMPGHGHVATDAITTIGGHFQTSEPFRDDIVDLPGVTTRNRYRDFAMTMNAIARAASGVKVIGGLSVGGAVAARAAAEDPALYARALLISPFFQATGRFVRDALYVADHLVPSTRISWGAGCLEERTEPAPRAGICQFSIDNLQASVQFGQETLALVDKIRSPVHVVGVEDDPAADNAAQAKAIGVMHAKACYFRKPATHSLLSRFDSPHDDKFWLKAALVGTAAYLTEGTPLKLAEPSTEKPFARCSTDV